jgi:hypothetical protein
LLGGFGKPTIIGDTQPKQTAIEEEEIYLENAAEYISSTEEELYLSSCKKMRDAEVKTEGPEQVVTREDGVKSLSNEFEVLKKEITHDILQNLVGQPPAPEPRPIVPSGAQQVIKIIAAVFLQKD